MGGKVLTMGGLGKVPLEVARKLACEVIEKLRPACQRIEIAGSIRRAKPEVGDIELVVVPASGKGQMTLDAVDAPSATAIPNLVRALITSGYFSLGPQSKDSRKAPFGERYIKVLRSESKTVVDLFIVLPPAQWGVVYLIRTGSADFSHDFVTAIQRKCFRSRDGHLERAEGDGWATVSTPEEEDVFRAVGAKFIEPHEREGNPSLVEVTK
jgi:DNA polymerase/3'-5' exonuclease PolX